MAQVLTGPDPHEVLGVPPNSTGDQIKTAYRAKAKELHPDVNVDSEAAERFRMVTEAYHAALTASEARPAKKNRAPRRKRAPRGGGSVFKRGHSPFYWIAWTHGGKRYEGSSQSERQKVAIGLLDKCRDACRDGTFTSIEAIRDGTRPTSGVTLADMRDAVLNDARRNRLDSIKRKEQAFAALIRHLGEWTPVEAIDKERISSYVSARLRDPVGCARDSEGKPKNPKTISNATVNRELDQLRVGLALLDLPVPRFKKLREAPARTRFPKPGEANRVIANLSPLFRARLEGPIRMMEITGWRSGKEVLGLKWSRVDVEAGTIRLEQVDTKGEDCRFYPFDEYPALAAIVRERREATERWNRDHGQVVDLVFWEPGTDEKGQPVAKPIRKNYKAWKAACRKAGVPDFTFHDFRRGAARDLTDAGVDAKTTMDLAGWKTRSVFDRYCIRDNGDRRAGVRKLAEAAQARDRAAVDSARDTKRRVA